MMQRNDGLCKVFQSPPFFQLVYFQAFTIPNRIEATRGSFWTDLLTIHQARPERVEKCRDAIDIRLQRPQADLRMTGEFEQLYREKLGMFPSPCRRL